MATVGEVDSEGHLNLFEDPEAWIKNNPASRLALVTSLKLNLWRKDDVEEIGESIGELKQLTRLEFWECRSLKREAITRQFHYCECLEELLANIGQLVSLTHLKLKACKNIKSLPMSIANLSNLTSLSLISCDSLTDLPSTVGQLKNLSRLELNNCNKIKSLPDSMKDLCSLDTLFIHNCNSLTQLPINLNVLHLMLIDCCPRFLPTGLINLKYLRVTVCSCSDESFVYWKDPYSLLHLTISSCFTHRNYIVTLPASLNQFVNLQVLSLRYKIRFVELPANLDGLAHLRLLDIQYSSIQCLPWSITKLCKLRLIMLPKDFRLETLPYELNNSVIISVEERHVRKSWEELKTEIGQLPNPFGGEIGNDAVQNPSIIFISLPGYLQLKVNPSQWIINNINLLKLVRFLDLQYAEGLTNSMVQFSELTHLYLDIADNKFFPDNYFVTLTRLTHLSLHFFFFRIDMSIFHSLSKLSNLQTLHLCLIYSRSPAFFHMPVNLKHMPVSLKHMPVSLKHLSLSFCNMRRLRSLEKLTNLKTLDLYYCRYCESLPPYMYLDKLRLIHCSFKSLPIGLHHLEILNVKEDNLDLRCTFGNSWNQLVNLKILSITCSEMEILPEEIARLSNLQKLLLKDCINLKELPSNIHELVKLQTLDISITKIKSLPHSFVKLCNLQHLILPKCFNLEILPRILKQVSIIDDTEEAYYKSMRYDASLYQTSADISDESEDEETELGVVPGESCNEDNNVVPTVEIHETIPDEKTSADPFKSISMGYVEHITTEQGGISQIDRDSHFNVSKGLVDENIQHTTLCSQNQLNPLGNGGFMTNLPEAVFFGVNNQHEKKITPEKHDEYNLPKEMPDNINVVNPWLKYDCSMQSPPKGLIKAEHLKISLCKCSKELLANLKESMNLLHLAIEDCSQHHVKKFPTNFNELANLKTLSIRCIRIESLPSFAGLCSLLKLYIGGAEKLPADLDKLDKLLAVDIHDTKIKCLPWSIKKLQNLRFLNLPLDFRLETLPCQLIESVIITLDGMHIRKTWKELKTEMELLSFRGVVVDETRKISTISSSGYLQLKDNPGLWIRKNKDLCLLVRSLELELPVDMQEVGDSIVKLQKLTYLYISGNIYLDLKHLSGVSKTLTHLSLQHCNIEFQSDSLGKLSNLEFLCLDLGDTNLPSDLDLLVKLRHLSLRHGNKHSNIDSMARLSNLKALDLFLCDFESLPANLKLAELKLSGSNIRSLPTSLYRLEILHDKGTCKRTECNVTSLNLKQLINLEKLSVTCYSMELIPSIERLQNLQALQLKDCSSLEALPNYLGELVKLCTLDISGTRIKSLPDSITMLSNLKNLILPKCFQQDNSVKYPNKGFINVTIDDIVELYFNYMSDDDDDETSMEISCDEQPLPHNLPAIQVRGDPCYNKGETSNPSGESSHPMQNTITTESEQGIAPACATKIYDCGEINHRALESEQNHIPQCNNVKIKMKRKDITLEMLQPFWSNHTTLVDAAEELGVKRSTLKRRIKELNVIWPRKGKKQQLDAKKRKLNYKAPFGSDCSQQNLVNLGNSAADHAENVEEHIMGSDLHTLPNHVSSNSNAVINLTPDTTMETIRGNLMEAIDSHQGAEVHLDGANERTLSDTLPQNEKSNNFIVKAGYNDDIVRFDFSLSKSIDQLKEEVANQLELEVNSFKIKYQDEDKDWVLVTRIFNLEHALNLSRSSNDSSVVRLLIVPKT